MSKNDLDWLSKNPLRSWRMKQEMTQDEAARALSCSLSTIRLWEKGTGTPGIDYLRRIAILIDAKSVDDLISRWQRWRAEKVKSRPARAA